jgi:hypothetical protein
MMEFHPEAPVKAPRAGRRGSGWLAWIAVLAVVVAGGVWAMRTGLASAPKNGTVRIETDPAGASVELEGKLRGLTPLTLTLDPGTHNLTVTHEGQTQAIAASVAAGVQSVHHLRWAAGTGVPAVNADRGTLQIISDPAGATVTVDGSARGVSPLSVDDLTPGEHQVVVQNMGRTHRRSVIVQAGSTVSLVVSNASSGAESGWLAPRASTSLQIFEDGRLIGTTDTDRIMLSAGTHTLEFVADALGFRAKRTVTINAGQTTTAPVSLPQAPMNLNAVPWAEVWIDGKSFGQTPIAGLMQPIGAHLVEFRHPELGNRQATVIVSLTEPARVAVDMRTR